MGSLWPFWFLRDGRFGQERLEMVQDWVVALVGLQLEQVDPSGDQWGHASAWGRFQLKPLNKEPGVDAHEWRAHAMVVHARAVAHLMERLPIWAEQSVVIVVDDHPGPEEALAWLASGADEVLPLAEVTGEYSADPAPLASRVAMALTRRQRALQMRRMYATDLGTGLPHRQQLVEHMSHLLALREREPSPMAALVLRVEGLTTARIRFGAEAAQVLRRKVAVRLRAGVRASDVVASLGDDQFAVLLASIIATGDAQRVGEKLLQSLATPFKVAGQDIAVAAALGVALYPGDAQEPEGLLVQAAERASKAVAQGRVGLSNFHEQAGAPLPANDA
jgi:diguanylate cyclase (GGDEF)-like protein